MSEIEIVVQDILQHTFNSGGMPKAEFAEVRAQTYELAKSSVRGHVEEVLTQAEVEQIPELGKFNVYFGQKIGEYLVDYGTIVAPLETPFGVSGCACVGKVPSGSQLDSRQYHENTASISVTRVDALGNCVMLVNERNKSGESEYFRITIPGKKVPQSMRIYVKGQKVGMCAPNGMPVGIGTLRIFNRALGEILDVAAFADLQQNNISELTGPLREFIFCVHKPVVDKAAPTQPMLF